MARVPLRLRSSEAGPHPDARGLLARAAARVAGVLPDALAWPDGPDRPLDPGATLADLRRLVRPLGLGAVEVSLSPEALSAPAWPVVAIRRRDAAPVAVVTDPWGRVRWLVPELDRLQAPGPPAALEDVGYAVAPRPGVARPPAGVWRVRAGALAVGAAAGVASTAAVHADLPVALGLATAALAGAGLLSAAVRTAEDRWRLSTGDPVGETPEPDGHDADGPVAWLPERVADPAAGLGPSVAALVALGLAIAPGAVLVPAAMAVAAAWTLVAAAASAALRPPQRSRAEVLAGLLAGPLLSAADDLRLVGTTERVRQAWLRRHRHSATAAHARRRSARVRTATLAALMCGAALSTTGLGLLASAAGVGAGWATGLWVRRRPSQAGLAGGGLAATCGVPNGTFRVSGLVVGHGDARLAVPELAVSDGALVVVTGPAASGKTRLVRVLLGLETPLAGEVAMGQTRLTPRTADTFRDAIAVLPHGRPLPGGDVAATVLGERFEAEPARAAWPALDAVGLGDLVRALPMRAMALVAGGGEGFSGGQRQRLAAARVLASTRPLRVLDEPLAGLDPDARQAVWDAVRRTPGSRLVLTRDRTLADDADLAYAIVDGGVVRQPLSGRR